MSYPEFELMVLAVLVAPILGCILCGIVAAIAECFYMLGD
jgi:hypothetical protein